MAGEFYEVSTAGGDSSKGGVAVVTIEECLVIWGCFFAGIGVLTAGSWWDGSRGGGADDSSFRKMRGTGDQGKDHLHGEIHGRDDVGVPVFSFAGDDMQVFVHGFL